MRIKYLLFVTTLLIVTFLIPQTSHSLYTGKIEQDEIEFSPTRLIVKLKPEVDKQVSLGKVGGKVTTGVVKLDELNTKFSVLKQEKLFREFKETALKVDKLSSIYVLKVPEGTDLRKMKKEYESLSEVEYVELDYKVELFQEPNDPLFAHQWYLNNTAQGYLGVNRIEGDYNDVQIIKFGTEDADIDALEAFQQNSEVVLPLVGIIDTGVDLDHEDLQDNIWVNPGEDLNGNGVIDESEINGIDDDHNGFVDDFYGWDFSGDESEIIEDNDPTDTYGHGTHCAGIVASVRNNALGVSGINSPSKIMAIKFFPNAFMSLGAKSIIYASDLGCDIINMSWGSAFPSKIIEDALDYAVYRGVLPIAAAGNSGAEEDFYPASYPQVFTVGASNSDNEVTYFSTYGSHIEVVAPGEDILSLRGDNTDMYAKGGASGIEPNVHIVEEKYYLADGTSMASPCAAGVAAHILAASPGISNERIIQIIQESADDITDPYGTGENLVGYDIYSGYGRVNLNSALALLSGNLAKIDYPYENAVISGEIAIIGTAAGDNFENYILEYGEGYSPTSWIEIANSTNPVIKDTLGIFNSFGLTGLYTLRLTVGDQNQAVVHFLVNNDTYVKITSPAEGDTIIGYTQVYGYTIAEDFSHYILEYGYGESPSYWFPITSSTKMVADYILGSWLVSFYEETDYSLRLAVETNRGEIYADTVVVLVKSIASDGWFVDLTSYASHGSLSPAVGDIDGDGYDEIVVGVGGGVGQRQVGGVEVFSHKGQREAGWPKDTELNMMSSPALADLDNDGIDDIVICSEQRGVHVYLSGSQDWIGSAGTGASYLWGLATPVIADLENDGHLEILTVDMYGTVYAWRKDGESVIPNSDGIFAQAETSFSSKDFPCLAVADLDRDGKNEVIAGTAYKTCNPEPCRIMGGIYIWDIDGYPILLPGDYSEKFAYIYGIAIANVDESKDLEIIVYGATGLDETLHTLCAFKKNGTQAAGFPILLRNLSAHVWFANHPALGDLEGDGKLEIVVTVWTLGEARIYAWHQDGTPLGSLGSGLLVSMKPPESERKREILSTLDNNIDKVLTNASGTNKEELAGFISTFDENPVFASAPETFGSPVLADINGDGAVDIVVRAGYFLNTGYERVFAWDYEGNIIPGFPLYATAQASFPSKNPYTPVMDDVDNDGKLDMILVTSYNIYTTPKLVLWEFDSYYDRTRMHWPKYMHDKQNSGLFQIENYTSYEISDVIYLIDYLFKGGPAPVPLNHGDVNCDGIIDVADVVYLINYLFRGGPAPCR